VNTLVYRTLFYVNIYGSYKLSNTVRFLANTVHVLVKHTDYKVSVNECARFCDEFLAVLSRPKVVVVITWRRALWHIAMKHMFVVS